MTVGLKFYLACAGLLFATKLAAHDPALHAAQEENSKAKPNCEAVAGKDGAAINSGDPVALAIQKKCARETQREDTDEMPPNAKPDSKTQAEHGGH